MPFSCSFIHDYPLKTFGRNETILLQEDTPDDIYCIKSGYVKGYDIDSQGCEQLLWLGATDDFFPMIWAFDAAPNVQYFFGAYTNTEVYAIPRAAFMEHLRADQNALMSLTHNLVVRMNEAFYHLAATKKARAEEKISHTLYFLTLRFGQYSAQGMYHILLPLTHQDIANLLGLARETVTIELRKLKSKGYIDYEKAQLSVNKERLAEIL